MTKSRSVVAWEGARGEESKGEITKVKEETLWVMDMCASLTVVVPSVYTHAKIYQIAYFKYMQFISCQLYLE